jgi:hypothetical protein
LKTVIDKAGYNGEDYTEHSNKRGAATHAANSGLADSEICDIGNWKNIKTARVYIENNTPNRQKKHLKLQKLL